MINLVLSSLTQASSPLDRTVAARGLKETSHLLIPEIWHPPPVKQKSDLAKIVGVHQGPDLLLFASLGDLRHDCSPDIGKIRILCVTLINQNQISFNIETWGCKVWDKSDVVEFNFYWSSCQFVLLISVWGVGAPWTVLDIPRWNVVKRLASATKTFPK